MKKEYYSYTVENTKYKSKKSAGTETKNIKYIFVA